jgi:recombination protein RecT
MTSTDVAIQEKKDTRPPIVVLRERLQAREGELKAALVDVRPEQFIRAVMTSVQINPEILGCTWQSIWNACLLACRANLLPDGIDGALVPFKGRCAWIPMYQGLMRQFRRSGQFQWIDAGLVRETEIFEYWIDQNGIHFKHVPGDDSDRPITKIYAIATTKDGGRFVRVLTKKEADKRRNMSRTKSPDAPWNAWTEEMYRKTALRALAPMLPSGRDIIEELDELPEIEAPTSTMAPAVEEKPSGPAAQLDQFAAGSELASPPASNSRTTTEDGGAGDQGAGDAADQRQGETAVARDPDANPTPEDVAYERGVQARAKGSNRRAIPGEYRDPARSREALAWTAGVEGQPKTIGG